MIKKILRLDFEGLGLKKNNLYHLFIQSFIVALVGLGLALVFNNYVININARNIGVGFSFLKNSAGFSIGQTLISYDPSDTHFRVYVIGLLNTLLASIISIGVATVIGFIAGIFLLSNNILLKKISEIYIEILRNIPPLLHVLFWYVVIILKVLPNYKDSINIFNLIFINVQGTTIPTIDWNGLSVFFLILFILLIGVSIFFNLRKQNKKIEGIIVSYKYIHLTAYGLILILWIVFRPFDVILPVQGKFRFVEGFTFFPELGALVLALGTYTSTFIATIVRTSILAIPKVQVEAAHSLGLSFTQRLRFVIIPLALRSMIPPLTNQYLNIIKNSSLGVAIGYPELIATFAGTSLNQTGRAIEIMTIVMFTYFLISIITSWIMNIYNKRISI